MDNHSYYKIGYVAKTHGLKGEVTIVLDKTAGPLQSNIKSLFVEVNNAMIPYFIQHISDRGDKAFVKLEEVDSPEGAALLKGCSLYLLRKSRPKLKPGEFYNDEVAGFEVEDTKLGLLGSIREVLQIGPNRLLAINGKAKEILIPVNGPFIQNLDKPKRKFRVDLPDGFLDI